VRFGTEPKSKRERVVEASGFEPLDSTGGQTGVRVNLHHGKIEDAVVRAVIQDNDGIKPQVDVVGLDLMALIDTRQVVE